MFIDVPSDVDITFNFNFIFTLGIQRYRKALLKRESAHDCTLEVWILLEYNYQCFA